MELKSAAARCRLDKHRVTEQVGAVPPRSRVGHRAAAPRHDGDPDLLGKTLGRDLVAEQPDDVARRPDEGDPGVLAARGEVGPTRRRSPQPTQTESARAAASAAITRSRSR